MLAARLYSARAAGDDYSVNMTYSSVITKPQPSDVDIAQAHTLEPIADIAEIGRAHV